MNQLNGGDCRTAPATPGLLNTLRSLAGPVVIDDS